MRLSVAIFGAQGECGPNEIRGIRLKFDFDLTRILGVFFETCQ